MHHSRTLPKCGAEYNTAFIDVCSIGLNQKFGADHSSFRDLRGGEAGGAGGAGGACKV